MNNDQNNQYNNQGMYNPNQPMNNNMPNLATNNMMNQPIPNNIPNQNMYNTNQSMTNQSMYDTNQPIPNQGMYNMNQPMSQIPPKKGLNSLIIAIPVIVILTIIVLVVYTGNKNYKKPIETYCQGLSDLNVDLIKEAVPEEYITDYGSELELEINSLKRTYETYNITQTITCEISEGTKVEESDLADLNESFQDEYNTSREITESYKVEVLRKTTSSYQGESETDEENIIVTVGKIDGTWYYLDEE